MREEDKQFVADVVARYLADCHPGGITFTPISSEIVQDEFGWKVPVLLDKEPDSLLPYFEALANVEIQLADQEHLKVLLVPAYDLIDAALEAA